MMIVNSSLSCYLRSAFDDGAIFILGALSSFIIPLLFQGRRRAYTVDEFSTLWETKY